MTKRRHPQSIVPASQDSAHTPFDLNLEFDRHWLLLDQWRLKPLYPPSID